jgi:hypothetical protein
MPVPHDLYVRFLITKGSSSCDEVNAELDRFYLPKITQDNFYTQKTLVFSTVPAYISEQIKNKKYGAEFLKWMRALEVGELWDGILHKNADLNTQLKLLYDIHEDSQLRLAVNALLIKRIKYEDIVTAISTKFSSLLKPAHIELYAKYFFNPMRMTRRDWKSFIGQVCNSERAIYFLSLTEAPEAVKVELGLPAEVDISGNLQFLLVKAFQKAKQYMKLSTKESNGEARAWIEQATRLVDKYERYRATDQADLFKTLRMEFEYINDEFPSADQGTLDELLKKAEKAG